MIKYLNLICNFFAFVPGMTLLIYMLLIYIKYKNKYFGLFSLSYFGTSIMAFCYLLHSLNSYLQEPIYDIITYYEMISMMIIIWSATLCIINIFYDKAGLFIRSSIVLIAAVPTVVYSLWYYNVIKLSYIESILYLYFFAILLIDCVLFVLRFRVINHKSYRKLAIVFGSILFSFLIVFLLQSLVIRFNFDTFMLYYFLWTVLLISFGWRHFIQPSLDKVFNVYDSFIEKYNITQREEEIIELILKGNKNATISKKLFISKKTVNNHIYNIYKKLNITSRFELICFFKQ